MAGSTRGTPTDPGRLPAPAAATAVSALARVPGAERRLLPRPWGVQHVVVAGDPAAPPLLLVHGWPEHWVAWRHVMAALAGEARLIAVDLRGYGDSQPEPGHVTPRVGSVVAGHVTDLVAVLDDLSVPAATVAAHDWGGWIAFRLAERHPRRVLSVVGVAITPPFLDPRSMARHAVSWSYVVPMALVGDRVARSRAAVTWMVRRSTRRRSVWADGDGATALTAHLDQVGTPAGAVMSRTLYRALIRHELPAALRRVRSPLARPAHIVVGEHETIARPEHWWRRSRAGEIDLTTVAGAGHWLPEEDPEATVRALRSVLGTGPLPSGPVGGQVDEQGPGERPVSDA